MSCDPVDIADRHERRHGGDLATRRGWRRLRPGRILQVLLLAGLSTGAYALQACGGGHLAYPLAVLSAVGFIHLFTVALLLHLRPGLLSTIAIHLGVFVLLCEMGDRLDLLILGPATGLLSRALACALAFYLGFENQYGDEE